MNLKEALRKCINNYPEFDANKSLQTEIEHFNNRYKIDESKSYSRIPRFYHKVPKDEDILEQRLREEARSNFLQRLNKQLLKNEELKVLIQKMKKKMK